MQKHNSAILASVSLFDSVIPSESIIHLTLLLAAIAAGFLILYQLIRLVTLRPDLVALFALAVIVCGFFILLAGDDINHAVLAIGAGVVSLFVAALNYSRGDKS